MSHEELAVLLRSFGKMMYPISSSHITPLVNTLYTNRNDFPLNEMITVLWGLTRMRLVTKKSWERNTNGTNGTTDTTLQMVRYLFAQTAGNRLSLDSPSRHCVEEPGLRRAAARVGSRRCVERRGHLVNLLYSFSYTHHPRTSELWALAVGVNHRLTALASSVSQTLKTVTPLELTMIYRAYVETGTVDARVERAVKRYVTMK